MDTNNPSYSYYYTLQSLARNGRKGPVSGKIDSDSIITLIEMHLTRAPKLNEIVPMHTICKAAHKTDSRQFWGKLIPRCKTNFESEVN